MVGTVASDRGLALGAVLLSELINALEQDEVLAERARRVLALKDSHSSELVPLGEAGMPVRTLRAAIAAKELPASFVGRQYLVRRVDLMMWLENRPSRQPPRKRKRKRNPEEAQQSPAQRAIERARRGGTLRVVGSR